MDVLIGGLVPHAMTRAMLDRQTLVPDDADAIDRMFEYLQQNRPTMAEIRDSVCEFYAIDTLMLVRPGRNVVRVMARAMFCYLAHRYARASFNMIRKRVGYHHHTTVWHAVHKIERWSVTRPIIRDDLDLLRLRICEKLLLRCKGRA